MQSFCRERKSFDMWTFSVFMTLVCGVRGYKAMYRGLTFVLTLEFGICIVCALHLQIN